MYMYCVPVGDFPGNLVVKNLPCNAGDRGFDPWVGKIPWRRARQPTPVFLLENPMNGGTWWATVHGVTKSRTQLKQLGRQAGTC